MSIPISTRRRWGQAALDAHRAARGDEDCDKADIVDAISDLLHCAVGLGLDISSLVRMSKSHLEAESGAS